MSLAGTLRPPKINGYDDIKMEARGEDGDGGGGGGNCNGSGSGSDGDGGGGDGGSGGSGASGGGGGGGGGSVVSHKEISRLIEERTLYASVSLTCGRSDGALPSLILQAAGMDATEFKTALSLIETVVLSPNWSPSNLPRLRDIVDQCLRGARATLNDRAEFWASSLFDDVCYQVRGRGWVLVWRVEEHTVARAHWQTHTCTPTHTHIDARAVVGHALPRQPSSRAASAQVAAPKHSNG